MTCTLVTPPVNGATRIRWIAGYFTAGANLDMAVTENGGTVIARYGGSLTGAVPVVQRFPGPGIIGLKGDATKVVLTSNLSGAPRVTVGYDFVPA